MFLEAIGLQSQLLAVSRKGDIKWLDSLPYAFLEIQY